jgi:hypothetical protein
MASDTRELAEAARAARERYDAETARLEKESAAVRARYVAELRRCHDGGMTVRDLGAAIGKNCGWVSHLLRESKPAGLEGTRLPRAPRRKGPAADGGNHASKWDF